MGDFKLENGLRIPLNTQEQVDHDANIAAFQEIKAEQDARKSMPDASLQIANLVSILLEKQVLESKDIPQNVLAAVNEKLSQSGLESIMISGESP